MYSSMKPIETIDGSLLDKLPEYVISSTKPLLLKGLVGNWPAVKAAQQSSRDVCNYIGQFYEGALVNTAVGGGGIDGAISYNEQMSGFKYQRKQVRLDDVFKELLVFEHEDGAPLYYVDSAPVDYCIPRFKTENDLTIGEYNPRVSLWVGNKTTVSAHYDIPDNIACVVAGHRRFTLFPPEQLENLYIGPLDFNPAGPAISMVDFKKPDFENFPRFGIALESALIADLYPGDAIYIPSMWWHHVEATAGFNVLVNYWWNSLPAYFGSPLDAFNHALICIKSLPEDERRSWRNLFEYYIFSDDPGRFSHIPTERLGVLGELDETAVRRVRSMLLGRLNR